MDQLKIIIALIVAIILQWTLRNVAEPLAYIDFPLIIVVYAALQRDSIKAILFGTVAGLAVDALSGGLLGSNAFSKTLVAYLVIELARRVYLDDLLLRIPVIAGACLLDDLIYYGLHRIFGQAIVGDAVGMIAYSLIATTITGTIIYILLDLVLVERMRPRKGDMFSGRRQTRRKNPIRFSR